MGDRGRYGPDLLDDDGSKRQPSARKPKAPEIAVAASITRLANAGIFSPCILKAGPLTLTAATVSPRCARTGAPTQQMPSRCSSESRACPRLRTLCKWLIQSTLEVWYAA